MLLGFLRPAYIDPGTGSLLIQGVVAAFVAVYFFFGSLFSKIKNAVLRRGGILLVIHFTA